jgi:hypothetical protein
MDQEIEIQCPKCKWKPDGKAHWACSCGHVWNTFETAGRCPKCSKRWEDTQCPGPKPIYGPGCGKWSKHIDWYKGLEKPTVREAEKILKRNTDTKEATHHS